MELVLDFFLPASLSASAAGGLCLGLCYEFVCVCVLSWSVSGIL